MVTKIKTFKLKTRRNELKRLWWVKCSLGINEIGVGRDYTSIKIRKLPYYKNEVIGYLTGKYYRNV